MSLVVLTMDDPTAAVLWAGYPGEAEDLASTITAGRCGTVDITERRRIPHPGTRADREAVVLSTTHDSIRPSPRLVPSRGPLRLRMAEHPGRNRLDGGWWPRSRDLEVELADLVDHFPAELGRIVRALFSAADWEPAPGGTPGAGRQVQVGFLPRDDTHLTQVTTSDGSVLHVLVVPPGFSDDQGEEALLAAATPGNAHTPEALLETVTEHPDIDPRDHWSDDGGSWWGPQAVAPSSRRRKSSGSRSPGSRGIA